MPLHSETILVLDFGSQYNQLILRRVREADVFCQMLPCDAPFERIEEIQPKGVILSGGPASVYEEGSPRCDPRVFEMGVPVLGICYGMQLCSLTLGGDVRNAPAREYGRTLMTVVKPNDLLGEKGAERTVWMSHGDQVAEIGDEFEILASTHNCRLAAVRHKTRPVYGVQFHPEVTHTEDGKVILDNFVHNICGCGRLWTAKSFLEEAKAWIRETVGDERVILGLSGGVDSSVVAVLLHEAIGDQLTCIFVDNGLLRLHEAERVEKTFRDNYAIDLVCVDAGAGFVEKLKGVIDPEKKRKIIGHEFIGVFQAEAEKLKGAKYLAQGTLYPDVIESLSAKGGPSATIKTHHNVGGLPEKLGFELIEPVKDLFKDEVRRLGEELGLPHDMVHRQPFPGPGLAVRVIGEVTPERLTILREADWIVIEEMKKSGWYYKTWQTFAVLLPVSTVGVMGDSRTYENVVALRAVTSEDAMTADWARLPDDLLATISSRIINEVRGVNRVVYDISSKPPSTIEWEWVRRRGLGAPRTGSVGALCSSIIDH